MTWGFNVHNYTKYALFDISLSNYCSNFVTYVVKPANSALRTNVPVKFSPTLSVADKNFGAWTYPLVSSIRISTSCCVYNKFVTTNEILKEVYSTIVAPEIV